MRRAAIAYRGGELEASEHNDVWTVRLRNLEVRASYLDLALAELLGDAPEAHRAAARLLVRLADVVQQQEAVASHEVVMPGRERRPASRRRPWKKPLVLGLRVSALSVVVIASFLVTTWLTVLR